MNNNNVIFLFLIIFLSLISYIPITKAYQFSGYTSSKINDLIDYGLTFNYSDADCRIKLQSRSNFSGGYPYTMEYQWFSPRYSLISSSSTLIGSDNTCKNLGASSLIPQFINADITSNIYESEMTYTSSATSGYLTTTTTYDCDANSGLYANFTIGRGSDSDGWNIYRTRREFSSTTANRYGIWNTTLINEYKECGGSQLYLWNYTNTNISGNVQVTGGYSTFQYIYPFSSSGGIIKYTFSSPIVEYFSSLACEGIYNIQLLNLDEKTITQIHTETDTCTSAGLQYMFNTTVLNGLITTQETDINYLWIISVQISGPANYQTSTISPPNLNMSILSYHADYECSDYSGCDDGFKYRVCWDPLGYSQNKTEIKSCTNILENATLGFENGEDILITTCNPTYNVLAAAGNWWSGVNPFNWITGTTINATACAYLPINITTERPKNWTIISGDGNYFNRFFVQFTSKWATEGSRSLMMWFIPPKNFEAIDTNPVTCGNITYGTGPILRDIFDNTTMRIGYNVTFPSTNMRIYYDARPCFNQVQQHGDLNAWPFGTICPAQCYANSCNTTPKSQFYFALTDLQDTDNAYIDWNDITDQHAFEIDLTGFGITVGKNYSIQFGVMPQGNIMDTDGDCVLIDNVRYDVLDESFLIELGGKCESGCCSEDYCYAHKSSTGNCIIKRELYGCASDPHLISKEDYCINSTYMNKYTIQDGKFHSTLCEYGCDSNENRCMTSEEAEEAEANEVITDTTEYIDVLFSFPMLVSIGILALCVMVPFKVKEGWPLVLFGIGQIVFVASINSIISPYFALAEIVFAGLIFAYFMSKIPRGG